MNQPLYSFLHTLELPEIYDLFLATFSCLPNAKKIFNAYNFASKFHKNQVRKGEPRPYIIHLARVALVMHKSFGINNTNMLIAGLFHDIIEDTKATYFDIKSIWGDEIADLVKSQTNPKHGFQTPQMKYKVREKKFNKLIKSNRAYKQLWYFDILDNVSDFGLIPKENTDYQKIPRWMKQIRDFYLPLSKSLGIKYYSIMNKLYHDYLKLGFRPSGSKLIA